MKNTVWDGVLGHSKHRAGRWLGSRGREPCRGRWLLGPGPPKRCNASRRCQTPEQHPGCAVVYPILSVDQSLRHCVRSGRGSSRETVLSLRDTCPGWRPSPAVAERPPDGTFWPVEAAPKPDTPARWRAVIITQRQTRLTQHPAAIDVILVASRRCAIKPGERSLGPVFQKLEPGQVGHDSRQHARGLNQGLCLLEQQPSGSGITEADVNHRNNGLTEQQVLQVVVLTRKPQRRGELIQRRSVLTAPIVNGSQVVDQRVFKHRLVQGCHPRLRFNLANRGLFLPEVLNHSVRPTCSHSGSSWIAARTKTPFHTAFMGAKNHRLGRCFHSKSAVAWYRFRNERFKGGCCSSDAARVFTRSASSCCTPATRSR